MSQQRNGGSPESWISGVRKAPSGEFGRTHKPEVLFYSLGQWVNACLRKPTNADINVRHFWTPSLVHNSWRHTVGHAQPECQQEKWGLVPSQGQTSGDNGPLCQNWSPTRFNDVSQVQPCGQNEHVMWQPQNKSSLSHYQESAKFQSASSESVQPCGFTPASSMKSLVILFS